MMDWIQIATVVGATTVPIIGTIIGLFALLKRDMDTINEYHREDIKEMRESRRAEQARMDEQLERFRIEVKSLQEKADTKFSKIYELWSDLALKVYKGK